MHRNFVLNFIKNKQSLMGNGCGASQAKNKAVQRGYIGQFFKQDDGATAVEFALLAMPFFMLIVGILEMSIFFAAGVAVEGASNHAARLLRTGQAQKAADPLTAFEDRLCDQINILVPCDELQYEVITIDDNSFMSVGDETPTFDDDGNLESQGFNPGGSDDVMIVRVAYRYNFLTPFMGKLVGDGDGTMSALHMSTVVIRSEPYEFDG